MVTEALIPLDTKPDWLAQEGTTFAFDETESAKFRCYVHKHPHGPTSYCGYAKQPVVSRGGSRCFAAVVLRNRKGPKGRKTKAVARVALFESERFAKETALLWHCQLEGMDVDGVAPGYMSWQERRRLIGQLIVTGRLHRIPGPRPILLVDKQEAFDIPDEHATPAPEQRAGEVSPVAIDAAPNLPLVEVAGATETTEARQGTSREENPVAVMNTMRKIVARVLTPFKFRFRYPRTEDADRAQQVLR
jgi:hypothetical protein